MSYTESDSSLTGGGKVCGVAHSHLLPIDMAGTPRATPIPPGCTGSAGTWVANTRSVRLPYLKHLHNDESDRIHSALYQNVCLITLVAAVLHDGSGGGHSNISTILSVSEN